MSTHWIIEIVGYRLGLYLSCDGFSDFSVKFVREAYKRLKVIQAKMAIEEEKYFPLVLIRQDEHADEIIEYGVDDEFLPKDRICRVDLQKKTIELVGEWTDSCQRKQKKRLVYKLEL